MTTNEVEQTMPFELTEVQWKSVSGDIHAFRVAAKKQGVTSKLVRKDTKYWITLRGIEKNVQIAFMMLEGIFVAKAPQTDEHRKQRSELDRAMADWQKQHGVGPKVAQPTIIQRKGR